MSKLNHISNELLVLEEMAQIEFVKDSTGRYSLIKIYLNDGSVFEEAKK